MMKGSGFAKLCLGTVQMGMKYGVNNAMGRQPSMEECFDVLQAAIDKGIDCFDTASAYGNAEKILGQFDLASKSTSLGTSVKVISKLCPNCEDAEDAVLKELQKSLQSLRAKSLYGYMLHRSSDMCRKGIMEGMERVKAEGLVQKIGVSVYEPEEALSALNDIRIDLIQIPCNLLDGRWEKVAFFEQAAKRGIEVHVRSVFLQGLLLMAPEQADAKVHGSGKFVRQFQGIAQSYGFTPKEAAFLSIVCHPGISRMVFGVDSREQLKENCSMLDKADSFRHCREALQEMCQLLEVPRRILMPSMW